MTSGVRASRFPTALGMTPFTKKLRRLMRYCPNGLAIIRLKNQK